MITGVKREKTTDKKEVLTKIDEIKKFFGIKEQKLEKLLYEKGLI
jgi:hypothetical protein